MVLKETALIYYTNYYHNYNYSILNDNYFLFIIHLYYLMVHIHLPSNLSFFYILYFFKI